MSTKPAAPAEPRPAPVEDIRSVRPYLLSRATLSAFFRRLVSILALVVLDLAGLILGLYAALVIRELYRDEWPPLWGIVWDTETDWLPFLTIITVLVFWVGGLYRRREVRAGWGQIVFSLILVSAITLAFGLGTGYHFTTYGLTPTALVLTALTIGILRSSYEVLTRDVLRISGARRRTVLVGEGEPLAELKRTLGSDRSGIRYEYLGAIAPNGDAGDLPVLGGLDALPLILREQDVHELIATDGSFDERELLELVEVAHRYGVKVKIAPRTTELLLQRAEYIPGEGTPLFELRPPALAGWDWGVKRGFDIIVSSLVVVVGSPLWLAIAATIKLDVEWARLLPRLAHRARRADVRDDEVPDDVRGRRGPPGRARGSERGLRAAVQDQATTRGSRPSDASSGVFRSTRCRRCSTSCGATCRSSDRGRFRSVTTSSSCRGIASATSSCPE